MARAGIIFDFDGTIALSEHVHIRAWQETAERYGHELPAGFAEHGVGRTDRELAAELARIWALEAAGAAAEEMLARKRRNYQERCSDEAVLVPGVVAALDRLAASFPLAVATSASRHDIAPTVKRYDLARFFGAIVTIEDVRSAKPDPESYRLAAQKIGVDAAISFAFEDSPTGAEAARGAGLRVIGMTTTFPAGGIGKVVLSIADYSELEALLRVVHLLNWPG